VEVDNTSAAGTDEVETLSALNDSVYGSITSVHGDVLGTTCGVATGAAGSGTLSGSTGGGVLPATLAVNTGKYTCQFDGKMCSNALVALINPPNATNCAAGVELKDTVSGTITADEGAGDVVTTQSPGNLTVDVCFSTTEATK
jgi:hypothetical protein